MLTAMEKLHAVVLAIFPEKNVMTEIVSLLRKYINYGIVFNQPLYFDMIS